MNNNQLFLCHSYRVIKVLRFCDKPFPQFDNLCKIFGKDRATGHEAIDLGEDMTEETQRSSLVDVEGLEDIVKET